MGKEDSEKKIGLHKQIPEISSCYVGDISRYEMPSDYRAHFVSQETIDNYVFSSWKEAEK